MGKILDFYKGKGKKPEFLKKKIEDKTSGVVFEIEEEDEETLVIDEQKLKEKLKEIKARNVDADIAILLDKPDKINSEDIKAVMDMAQQIKDESDMIEFEDDEV